MTDSTEWIDRQIALSRDYVAGDLDPEEYTYEFMQAQTGAARAGGLAGEERDALLNDLLFAVCNHVDSDGDAAEFELDDDQLRETVQRHLVDYDEGKYDPRYDPDHP